MGFVLYLDEYKDIKITFFIIQLDKIDIKF